MKFTISSLLFAASALGVCTSTSAETTLRMAHLWPAGSVINKQIFQEWSKQVEKDSNGQLNVENYPSQTLSKAEKTYESAANGIADIAVTLQGYTAGRFPLTEVVQLPGVVSNASQGSCILQTLYDEGDIAEEYSDTRVLFLFTTGPAYLHSRDTEIQKPGDMEGLRIRRPSAVAGEMLSSMGAQPLGMPAPDIYTSLQRGVMDGLSFPWEAMTVFRINELVSHHLELPYYAGAIVATMSQSSYDDLPQDMQEVINKNSGMKWSRVAGRVFDELDRKGREEAIAQGDTIHVIEDPLSDPDWAEPLRQGSRNYLLDLEERGLGDADEVYEKALALGERCQA